jgi:hypothetical protein
MKHLKTLLLFLFFTFLLYSVHAQYTQKVRGNITDQIVQTPLAGATITLLPIAQSTITDNNGNFSFTNVPVGTYSLRVEFVGYRSAQLSNLLVTTGKELVLTINMESELHENKAVVVKSASRKNKPLNEMSLVSTRAFTVEETQRYAASVNDPLRMATNYAGVAAMNDGNNDIVIRGNTPNGLLYRMEGIDIPNPNHFASAGRGGGGISILSSQLLDNSDFSTGAFAAEYGNAISGVFDLKLRKGNNEKHEYTAQAGFLGLNLAAEGPMHIGGKGSYLINYRYSTLSILSKFGLDVGDGKTDFQDLSYNFYMPTKKLGTFTLFGFGGLSSQVYDPKKDSTKWESAYERYSENFVSNTGFTALTHSITFGNRTNLRSAIGYSYHKTGDANQYINNDYSEQDSYKDAYITKKVTFSSTLNHKFNAANTLRTGIILNQIDFNYYKQDRETPDSALKLLIDSKGSTQTVQAFSQWQSKINNKLLFNAGLHYMFFAYNHTSSIEPRAALRWDFSNRQSVAFAYGLHSQLQPFGVYFAEVDNDGIKERPNKDLGFTRSHHFVLSYNYAFSNTLKLKTEVYYQHLFNIPVGNSDTSTLAVININEGYLTDALVNKGKGRNYGAEISLEKNLTNGFYYMLSTSLYQSKYKALDGIERNTRYNGNYIANFVIGKEFNSANQRRTYGINIRTLYMGGYRTTPIDFEASQAKGETVYVEKQAYSIQNPAYFRTDLKLSMRWNRRHTTSTLSLDLQNASNHLNVYGQWYDPLKNNIRTAYQNGLIPILNYKVEF